LASLVSKLIRLTILGWLDRGGGAVVGMALGTLVASVLLLALSAVPGGNKIHASYDASPLGRFILYAAPSVYEQVRRMAGSDVDAVWDRTLDAIQDQAAQGKQQAQEKVDDALDR